MRVELDFKNKVITIDEDTNIKELFDLIEKLEIDKSEWTLEPLQFQQPINIPIQPWNTPWTLPIGTITYTSASSN